MKSFVALLVVALALTASAQSGCGLSVPTTTFNSSAASALTTAFTSACVQCNSGFLLGNGQGSTCATACATGCSWCYNNTYCYACSATYILNATTTNTQACVSCGSNAATCTISSGTITISTCLTGYFLVGGACVACNATGAGTAASPWGIANCVACSSTATVSGTNNWVTCTACASGYAFVNSDSVPVVVVAYCFAVTTTAT